jgi:signal transduction histidine kinase
MSLGHKIIIALSVVVLLYAAIDNVVQRAMVGSRFETLEQEAAAENVQRVARGMQHRIDDLASQCRRWAAWESLWESSGDPGGPLVGFEPVAGALERQGLDLLYVLEPKGRVIWGRIEEPTTRDPISVREFPNESLSRSHVVFRYREDPEQVAGIYRTSYGPMLIASAPIRAGSDEGEERGTLVMGRFLDRLVMQEIGAQVGADFVVWDIDDEHLPPAEESLRDVLTATSILQKPHLEEVDENVLHAYTMIPDLVGNPEILVRARVDRDVTRSGASAVNYALLSTLGTAVLIFFVLLRLLQHVVVNPLGQLAEHAMLIGQCEDTSARIGSDRDDEIGKLSREFDAMIEKLERSREQLGRASRLAGMSEIATGVIHNVGNVLNSVNVSASLVIRKAEQLSLRDLEQMHSVLQQNEQRLAEFLEEDPRGKHLLPFLEELIRELSSQRGEIIAELRGLEGGLDHIMKLVRAQQAYAGNRGVFEPTDLPLLVDEALTICQQSYKYTADVSVTREFEDLPKVPVDRNKLMEVLVNLIQNAAEAMVEAGVEEKRLTLRLNSPREGVVRLEVADNGIGISPEDQERVFQHGFTTKEKGHGFGLHSAANAATEMCSHLAVSSEGPGRGATFTLDLPMDEANLARAA